ncbi:gag-pol polyprotein [Tanacetum coccineum]|uniref:Gag-pol polyprotein n=1 Tax=Tanacetum coccineum TaxID=301880 RepID=A0ABQ5IP69_9ASTR
MTKDHPLEQVIGEPSRPVLTRNQLRSDGDMCMYALTVSTVEPKNVKEAMTDPAWIESMQEELLQFKRLDVWVLVPLPDVAYNNRFHELALMCHELVPTEKKKIEWYVRGFPERIKGNITSLKPATLHEAINMARELVEQSVQATHRLYEKIAYSSFELQKFLEVQGDDGGNTKKDLGSLRIVSRFNLLWSDRIRIIDLMHCAHRCYRQDHLLLNQKKKAYVWGDKQDEAFQILKEKLCNAPMLALPDGPDDFVVYCDASKQGFGCVMMHRGKVIAYASRQLKKHENFYSTHDMELVRWCFAHKIRIVPTEMELVLEQTQ